MKQFVSIYPTIIIIKVCQLYVIGVFLIKLGVGCELRMRNDVISGWTILQWPYGQSYVFISPGLVS